MTRLRGRQADSSLQALLIILLAVGTGTLLEYFGIIHLLPNSIKEGSFLRDKSELLSQPVIASSPISESQKVGQEYA